MRVLHTVRSVYNLCIRVLVSFKSTVQLMPVQICHVTLTRPNLVGWTFEGFLVQNPEKIEKHVFLFDPGDLSC